MGYAERNNVGLCGEWRGRKTNHFPPERDQVLGHLRRPHRGCLLGWMEEVEREGDSGRVRKMW